MKDRRLLKYGRLTVLYNYNVLGPQVAHMLLSKANLNPTMPKSSGGVALMEHAIPKEFAATRADFNFDGLDFTVEKGHLIARVFMRIDVETSNAINLLSTMTPQRSEFNQLVWNIGEYCCI